MFLGHLCLFPGALHSLRHLLFSPLLRGTRHVLYSAPCPNISVFGDFSWLPAPLLAKSIYILSEKPSSSHPNSVLSMPLAQGRAFQWNSKGRQSLLPASRHPCFPPHPRRPTTPLAALPPRQAPSLSGLSQGQQSLKDQICLHGAGWGSGI